MKPLYLTLAAIAAATVSASAQVRITEFSYKGLFGEFIELANTGSTTVDLTGWSYDDNSDVAGTVTLPSVSLAQNQTIIITEVSDAVFRQAWYEDSEEDVPLGLIDILENNTTNLGRSDQINIYNSSNVRQDRLTYNDQGTGTVDGPRTEDISAKPGPTTSFGTDNFSTWILSGTGEGGTPNGNAWKAGAPGATGPIGSPGVYPN